ncbi:MAG: hypothetical protein MJ123_05070 [Lachnospiraceae bacterium]|nr:hypothetical protein [Lachnospiraceae bacterium]
MKDSSANNITPIKQGPKINPGIVIFVVIFIYIIISIYNSTKHESIVGYQVKVGTLSENRIYKGIALRDESIVISTDTGYLSLFLNEGSRAAYNNLVYAIDESGKLSDVTQKDPSVDNRLSDAERNDLRLDLQLFSRTFKPTTFSDSYSFESKINNELLKIENRQLLDNIDEINSLHLNDIVNFYHANDTGIVTYFYDGFETKKASDLAFEDFNEENYSSKLNLNDDLIESGQFVYKYTNNENWSICILVPNEELIHLADADYVKVKFLKNQTESWGKVSIVKSGNEGSIVELTFTNSMISFVKDRFVEIELLLEEDTGLKIPKSSITENNFFLIDKKFVSENGNLGNLGVNKKMVSDSGETYTKFVEITIYEETEEEYYVDTSNLSIGDVLVYVNAANVVDSEAISANNEFTVGKQGTLIGVYNINKGYADFKKIKILYENDEYAIIGANETLGLNAFDYIALDAKTVTNNDFVY